METIFDYNPTDLELKRFGGKEAFKFCQEHGIDPFACVDDNLYQLGLLFSMRGDDKKANEYWSRMKDKSMLGTLVQDF